MFATSATQNLWIGRSAWAFAALLLLAFIWFLFIQVQKQQLSKGAVISGVAAGLMVFTLVGGGGGLVEGLVLGLLAGTTVGVVVAVWLAEPPGPGKQQRQKSLLLGGPIGEGSYRGARHKEAEKRSGRDESRKSLKTTDGISKDGSEVQP